MPFDDEEKFYEWFYKIEFMKHRAAETYTGCYCIA